MLVVVFRCVALLMLLVGVCMCVLGYLCMLVVVIVCVAVSDVYWLV